MYLIIDLSKQIPTLYHKIIIDYGAVILYSMRVEIDITQRIIKILIPDRQSKK